MIEQFVYYRIIIVQVLYRRVLFVEDPAYQLLFVTEMIIEGFTVQSAVGDYILDAYPVQWFITHNRFERIGKQLFCKLRL
jgi:hypothetical protein